MDFKGSPLRSRYGRRAAPVPPAAVGAFGDAEHRRVTRSSRSCPSLGGSGSEVHWFRSAGLSRPRDVHNPRSRLPAMAEPDPPGDGNGTSSARVKGQHAGETEPSVGHATTRDNRERMLETRDRALTGVDPLAGGSATGEPASAAPPPRMPHRMGPPPPPSRQ